MKFATPYQRMLAVWRPLALFTIMSLAPGLATAQDLVQLFSNGAGAVSQVASVQVAQDQFVTAVINSTGNLEVIGWYADFNTNQLVRQGTVYAGPASAVAVSSPFSLNVGISGTFTTAAINSSGNLDISYWQMQPNGAISWIAETQGDHTFDITSWNVSIASVYYSNTGNPQFVTAIPNASGNLEVSLWYLDTNNQIQLSGTASAGRVFQVGIAALHDSLSDVVTAVMNGSGDEELIQWYYGRFGKAVSRGKTTYTSTPTYDFVVTPGVFYLNNPPYNVNAFYTASINSSTTQNTVAAWNQNLGSQSQDAVGNNGQVALVGYNTAAIEAAAIQTNSYTGSNLYVFDQNNSNSFGQVASANAYGVFPDSISLLDTSSPNVTVFAVAGRETADVTSNLQIQVWSYIRACSPWCPAEKRNGAAHKGADERNR